MKASLHDVIISLVREIDMLPNWIPHLEALSAIKSVTPQERFDV